MELTNYINITSFCQYHRIETQVIFTFREMGLVEVVESESEFFLEEEKLGQLERMVRLYKDLQLSPNGVEVVMGLLEKVEKLQQDNQELKKRLKRWER